MPDAAHAAEAIRNLLGSYCQAMDAAQWSVVGELFAHARLIDAQSNVVAEGAAQVQALYERGTQLYEGSPRTRHITASSVIEIDGLSATARSSYVVFQQLDGFPLQPIISGRYHDTFVADGAQWRFAVRQFHVDLVGDLSHHLTYEVPKS